LRRGTLAALPQIDDLVAHFRFDGAQLVFRVDAVLFAEGKEVLALCAQLPREREDADFFFLLQAELPVVVNWTYGFPQQRT
jgi:hypothetical protein